LELGQAIATSAGKLDAKFVIHAASMELGKTASAESIRSSFRNALELADSLECETLAVPAIGCGIGGFNLEQGAELLLQEAHSFQSSAVKTVFFVLLSPANQSVFLRKAQELGIPLTDWFVFQKREKEEAERRELERSQEEESIAEETGSGKQARNAEAEESLQLEPTEKEEDAGFQEETDDWLENEKKP
jgi:hypothetical protein